MDFVFYDLETTGTSPAFDQPLQFAAIRTDEDLIERDRVDIRCRLAPHILPSPEAMVVTGVTPEQLSDPDLPTLFDFARRLAELTEEWAPAIWTGYNSIKFDEEFMRQVFYQNLLPSVYATQFNGNTRLDIMTAVHAVHARDPGILDWPKDPESERTVFRLDRLAPANGFNAHRAHDALGDVEATIHLARRIASGNPRLWSELVDNATKTRVKTKLESFRPLELVLRFGGDEPRSIFGCHCGYATGSGTMAGFFDLDAADPSELLAASDDTLFAAVDATPKIIRGVATNRAPALLAVESPDAEHVRRSEVIASSLAFQRRVGDAMASRFAEEPDAPPKPVEKRIHEQFYGYGDKQSLEEFHRSDWQRRSEIVGSLSDRRLRQLGRRLIAYHCPSLLSSGDKERYHTYLQNKWRAADVPETEWMTIEKARAQIESLRSGNSVESSTLDAIAKLVEERAVLASS